MKLLLGIALLLLAAQLSESACFFQLQSTSEPGKSKVCIDTTDGSVHKVGDSWNATNCMVCWCENGSYRCCERSPRTFVYPEDCVAVFDNEACQYRTHAKGNPSLECS
ncbi:beta-microseminoprotein-like [Leucoraja erinacea]|uniref:beta-microseminoprotein-like n=1 Tax=Leucoraja erinaceus TaxID=7782 RepID=UPI002458C793|nr:beta-microseminoprotein-like [Leucoraja erinacea]